MDSKKTVNTVRLVWIGIFLLTCGCAFAAENGDEEEVMNMGEDDTAPRRRFDVRQELKQNDGDSDSYTTTLRLDLPVLLDQGRSGIFYYRMDMPFVASDKVGDDNPNGDNVCGTGDLLTQFRRLADSVHIRSTP
jgi:hypothetical protein